MNATTTEKKFDKTRPATTKTTRRTPAQKAAAAKRAAAKKTKAADATPAKPEATKKLPDVKVLEKVEDKKAEAPQVKYRTTDKNAKVGTVMSAILDAVAKQALTRVEITDKVIASGWKPAKADVSTDAKFKSYLSGYVGFAINTGLLKQAAK